VQLALSFLTARFWAQVNICHSVLQLLMFIAPDKPFQSTWLSSTDILHSSVVSVMIFQLQFQLQLFWIKLESS